MSKYIKIVIGIVVVALLVVAGIKKIKSSRAKDTALPKAKIYPIVVSVISPKITNAKLTLPYLAEVKNDKDVRLSSRISARILQIKPSSAHVKKGDIVVKLDTTAIKSTIKSTKQQLQATSITLNNLEQTHKRTLQLLKIQGASIEESQKEASMIANTKAQLNALNQKIIELKNNLSYATITSPVDGVIAKTFSNKGALSLPGKPLVAISSKNGFYLMLRVPTTTPIIGVKFDKEEYKAIALGSTFNSLAEYKVYTGKTNLTSGDKVEVDVTVFNQEATLLPFNAILNKNNKSYVLEVLQNKAKLCEVSILQTAQQGVVITQNLEGKKIITARPDILLKLTSGYPLKVKE